MVIGSGDEAPMLGDSPASPVINGSPGLQVRTGLGDMCISLLTSAERTSESVLSTTLGAEPHLVFRLSRLRKMGAPLDSDAPTTAAFSTGPRHARLGSTRL